MITSVTFTEGMNRDSVGVEEADLEGEEGNGLWWKHSLV